MKAVKHPGTCKLCGQFTDLTSEHIPPKSAFNSSTVKVFPIDEVIKHLSGASGSPPWEPNGIRGTLQQGGHKKYCLCRSCNNNTGQWYMRTYTDLAKTFHAMIVNEKFSTGYSYSFVVKGFYPLRFYKAMLTLLCDINNDCFGDDNLRQFLMNKDTKNTDLSRYSLYMYLVSSQMPRMWGLSGVVTTYKPYEAIMVSEVASYPIGFALYLDKPKTYTPFGVCVDGFAAYDYDEKCDIQFHWIPYLDLNTQFPIDYRSKDDIVECIENTERVMDNIRSE